MTDASLPPTDHDPATLTAESAHAVDAFFDRRFGVGAASRSGDTPRMEKMEALGRLLEQDVSLPAAAADRAGHRVVARTGLGLGSSRPIATLGPDDAAALDALIEARASGRDRGPRPAGAGPATASLDALLNLLNHDAAALPDADPERDQTLVAATLERCREARQRRRFHHQVASLAHGRGPAGASSAWRQVMAAAGVVLLALSLLLPALQHGGTFAERMVCQNNLGLAGRGLAAYAADFGGLMPRAPMRENGKWWNVGQASDDEGKVESNSAHLYLLVRRGHLNPEDLACPSNAHADDVPLTRGDHDWAKPEQVSFSFQNVSGRSVRLVRTPDLAVLADKNPLFVARAGQVTFDPEADVDSPSRQHGGSGQNVLRADGVVVWTIRPTLKKHDLFDDRADNIWVASGVRDYDGDEHPAGEDDSFLVP